MEGQNFVARVEAGETLGEVNVFDPAKASATVVAPGIFPKSGAREPR